MICPRLDLVEKAASTNKERERERERKTGNPSDKRRRGTQPEDAWVSMWDMVCGLRNAHQPATAHFAHHLERRGIHWHIRYGTDKREDEEGLMARCSRVR